VLKAEVRSAGDNPPFVGTSWDAPTPQRLYEDLSCARGNGDHALKAVKGDLRRDRTAATPFLAKATRLGLAWAAYALPHAWRTQTLQPTGLAQAQPATIILTLFKIAAQVKQYKDRLLLHLPNACPVQALLQRITTWLYVVPPPVGNTSSGGASPRRARPLPSLSALTTDALTSLSDGLMARDTPQGSGACVDGGALSSSDTTPPPPPVGGHRPRGPDGYAGTRFTQECATLLFMKNSG